MMLRQFTVVGESRTRMAKAYFRTNQGFLKCRLPTFINYLLIGRTRFHPLKPINTVYQLANLNFLHFDLNKTREIETGFAHNPDCEIGRGSPFTTLYERWPATTQGKRTSWRGAARLYWSDDQIRAKAIISSTHAEKRVRDILEPPHLTADEKTNLYSNQLLND